MGDTNPPPSAAPPAVPVTIGDWMPTDLRDSLAPDEQAWLERRVQHVANGGAVQDAARTSDLAAFSVSFDKALTHALADSGNTEMAVAVMLKCDDPAWRQALYSAAGQAVHQAVRDVPPPPSPSAAPTVTPTAAAGQHRVGLTNLVWDRLAPLLRAEHQAVPTATVDAASVAAKAFLLRTPRSVDRRLGRRAHLARPVHRPLGRRPRPRSLRDSPPHEAVEQHQRTPCSTAAHKHSRWDGVVGQVRQPTAEDADDEREEQHDGGADSQQRAGGATVSRRPPIQVVNDARL